MPQTLASHDDYLITYHPVQDGSVAAGPLVITFGGFMADLKPHGFGTGWCRTSGWDSIYVAPRRGTQFQGLTLEAFFDAVLPVIDGRDVVTYGASLGGYAATYFGGAIDARIVAASPMLPAWPPLGRQKHMIPIMHTPLPNAPTSAHTPVVIFDPHVADDLRFITELVAPAYPALRKIEVPYAGHTVLQFLANEKVISRVMRALIGDDEIIAFTAEGRENPIWHFNRAKSLRGKDPAAALAHYQKSIDLAPTPQSIGAFLSLCMQRKMLDAAQTMIDWTQTQDSPNTHIPPAIAERAAEMGLRLNAA